MNLLFCNYEYPPLGGGGGVVMASLARQLARAMGGDVDVIDVQPGAQFEVRLPVA